MLTVISVRDKSVNNKQMIITRKIWRDHCWHVSFSLMVKKYNNEQISQQTTSQTCKIIEKNIFDQISHLSTRFNQMEISERESLALEQEFSFSLISLRSFH